jgi:hypothetical protein
MKEENSVAAQMRDSSAVANAVCRQVCVRQLAGRAGLLRHTIVSLHTAI